MLHKLKSTTDFSKIHEGFLHPPVCSFAKELVFITITINSNSSHPSYSKRFHSDFLYAQVYFIFYTHKCHTGSSHRLFCNREVHVSQLWHTAVIIFISCFQSPEDFHFLGWYHHFSCCQFQTHVLTSLSRSCLLCIYFPFLS